MNYTQWMPISENRDNIYYDILYKFCCEFTRKYPCFTITINNSLQKRVSYQLVIKYCNNHRGTEIIKEIILGTQIELSALKYSDFETWLLRKFDYSLSDTQDLLMCSKLLF